MCGESIARCSWLNAQHGVRVALACLLYMACSVGMNLVNKQLTSFELPISVVVVQMLVAVLLLLLMPLRHYFGSRSDVLRWACGVSLLWGVKMSTSMLAMQYAPLGLLMVTRASGDIPRRDSAKGSSLASETVAHCWSRITKRREASPFERSIVPSLCVEKVACDSTSGRPTSQSSCGSRASTEANSSTSIFGLSDASASTEQEN